MGACIFLERTDENVSEVNICVSTSKKFAVKLDPKDYRISNQEKGIFIKRPGDINGTQFIIEDTKDVTIFLLDHCGPIAMDECHGCTVVTGPCEASIFARNCSDCKLIVACQQLRLRDCINFQILCHSQSAPIIESSKFIEFGCYSWDYFGIGGHFKACQFSIFKNPWFEIFDYTPSETNERNYSLLGPQVNHETLLGNNHSEIIAQLRTEGLAPQLDDDNFSFVLRTCGPDFYFPSGSECLHLIFLETIDEMGLREAIEGEKLVRTAKVNLTPFQIKKLYKLSDEKCKPAKNSTFVSNFKGKKSDTKESYVVMVIESNDIDSIVTRISVSVSVNENGIGGKIQRKNIGTITNENARKEASHLLFEVWK
jgi:hypothetical protein